MPSIERQELNALLSPCPGLMHSTQRLTDVIKRVGGFRIGSLPTFGDAADKASCPCLVLLEDTPLPLGQPDETLRKAAGERVMRLALAANRLGCNSLALKCDAPDTQEGFDTHAVD